MPLETTFDQSQRLSPGRLWFGAAGAAIAWALQGFTCFMISTQACADFTDSWGPLSGTGVRILIGCVTAGYLAAAAAATIVSYRNWRQISDHRRLIDAEGIGREQYMALGGVFVGAASVLGLIWAGIPPIFFNVCNTFR
jgi:hypothetical protein